MQCLANPVYLNYMAQQKTLDKPEFVAYLGYLQYFKEPKYAKFLQYVHRGALPSHSLLTNHVTQSPWANAPCTRAVATGAFPTRHSGSGSYGQAGYRRPAECCADEEGLIQVRMFDTQVIDDGHRHAWP